MTGIQLPQTPFALLARQGSPTIEVLSGHVVDVDLLADIPLSEPDARPNEVLALIPYRQVRERGFAAVDDGAPLRCLVVDEHLSVERDELVDSLPIEQIVLTDGGFDISDDDYAEIVERVIADEIGRGEGANFVIHRAYTAKVDAYPML